MIESEQHMGYFANFLAVIKNLSFHINELSTLAGSHVFLLIKKYIPYPMMLKNYNNILLFKDLIELTERILVFRFEKNTDFMIQLTLHKEIIEKAMRLKFCKLQMGLYYYPAMYESIHIKKDGKDLTDQEMQEIETRVALEKEKLNEGDFELIDKR